MNSAPLESARYAITGIGMLTPVGHGAEQACASIRAGITRFKSIEHFYFDEKDSPVLLDIEIGSVDGLTDGFKGLGRWTQLTFLAMKDLMANSGLSKTDMDQSGLFLALPPTDRPGVDQRLTTMLGSRLGSWLDCSGLDSRTFCYPEGHAATAKAVACAIDKLMRREVAFAIVGGVDSLVEEDALEYFYENNRLLMEENTKGFLPSEGAAFFTLENMDLAVARSAKVLCTLDAVGTAMESETLLSGKPASGRGLSEALQATLGQLPDQGEAIGLIICDLNGETYRSKEFAYAASRCLARTKQSWDLWHPTDTIGDTGAASLAISACVGARALQRGYAQTDSVLVCGSSDGGFRGALHLGSHLKGE